MPDLGRYVAECSIECDDGCCVDNVKVFRQADGCKYIDPDGNHRCMAKILKAKIFVTPREFTPDFFKNCPEGLS